MILSRTKSTSATSRAPPGSSGGGGGGGSGASASASATYRTGGKSVVPTFEEFLLRRDYTGARTVLEYHDSNASVHGDGSGGGGDDLKVDLWSAFCNFHLGDYARALEQYEQMRGDDGAHQQQPAILDGAAAAAAETAADDGGSGVLALNAAVCMFYLGRYAEAQQLVERIPNGPLKVRLLFHLSHKLGDEERLMELHGSLRDVYEDQLSLAGLHYLRGHYQEAIDIYKRVQLERKDFVALNIYIALCYYKLDYFDISQEVLDIYLSRHPDSIVAVNLKACNRFRLFDGRAAEALIRSAVNGDGGGGRHAGAAAAVGAASSLGDRAGGATIASAMHATGDDPDDAPGAFGRELLTHNLVVFRGGEGALQVLPPLLDIVPEARLNLAIYYLRGGDVERAEQLIRDVQPAVSYEYVLKGAVHAALAQHSGSKEHLKNAQQYLHLVGGSAAECDTIPGRQSMASAFFLYGQFEEVLVYLNSIRSYFVSDDTFNYNYAQAKAATGYFREAEEVLLQIRAPDIRHQHTYDMVLARCHINVGHADLAWLIYAAREPGPDAFGLLQLIANECYRVGEFWVAARAFDVLERMDPNPEFWEGKRGACAGAMLAIVQQRTMGAPPDGVAELCGLLRDSANPQAEQMLRAIRRYASSAK